MDRDLILEPECAAVLAAGLLIRPQRRSAGDVLITLGALLGAIWFWTVVMTPIAIAVIVGVVVSYMRSAAPAINTSLDQDPGNESPLSPPEN